MSSACALWVGLTEFVRSTPQTLQATPLYQWLFVILYCFGCGLNGVLYVYDLWKAFDHSPHNSVWECFEMFSKPCGSHTRVATWRQKCFGSFGERSFSGNCQYYSRQIAPILLTLLVCLLAGLPAFAYVSLQSVSNDTWYKSVLKSTLGNAIVFSITEVLLGEFVAPWFAKHIATIRFGNTKPSVRRYKLEVNVLLLVETSFIVAPVVCVLLVSESCLR